MDALGAGVAIGLASLGGAVGIGIMMGYAYTSIARQPKEMSKIRPLIFIGIAFAEATVLYALVISLILLGNSGDEAKNAAAAGTESLNGLAAGLAIGFAALGGAIGIGIMMGKAFESVAEQPAAMGKIRPLIFVGIAFAEATVLYALVVSLILLGSRSGEEAKNAIPSAENTPPAITTTVTNDWPND
jgi:F-type H+-transporting ATPase subunit c